MTALVADRYRTIELDMLDIMREHYRTGPGNYSHAANLVAAIVAKTDNVGYGITTYEECIRILQRYTWRLDANDKIEMLMMTRECIEISYTYYRQYSPITRNEE